MRAWDGVAAWERRERQSVAGAKAVRLNLSQGPYCQTLADSAVCGHQ